MINKLKLITILVKNIDEALDFYTKVLGFKLHTDATMPDGFRWVTVSPEGQSEMEFALMLAQSDEEIKRVGSQVGQQSIGVLGTNDCKKTYQDLKEKGVKFIGEPIDEPWGIGVTLEDLYGNKFYLNQEK